MAKISRRGKTVNTGVSVKRRGKTMQTSAFARDDTLFSYPSKHSSKLLGKVLRDSKKKTSRGRGKNKMRTGGGF